MYKTFLLILLIFSLSYADIINDSGWLAGDCPSSIGGVSREQDSFYSFTSSSSTWMNLIGKYNYYTDTDDTAHSYVCRHVHRVDNADLAGIENFYYGLPEDCPEGFTKNDDGVCQTSQGCGSNGLIDPQAGIPEGWIYAGVEEYIGDCARKVDGVQYIDSMTYALACLEGTYCMLKKNPDACDPGYVKNDSGECCNVNGADMAYGVDEAECSSISSVKIDDLLFLTDVTWNSCLGKCVAKANRCPKDLVFDNTGLCVPATLDDSNCIAQGGHLENFRTTRTDSCISNVGASISPCCEYEADCVDSSGTVINIVSTYVSCGDSNETFDDNTTSDLNTTIDLNVTDNTDSQTPSVCGTCSTLGDGWTPTDTGLCKHTTVNNVVQYTSCPSQNNQDNTVDVDINTTPDGNSTFDMNITSDTNTPNNVCPCCPPGYRSIGGLCGITNSSGQIVSYVACPCDVVSQNEDGNTTDTNGTDDGNSTEDNASDLMSGFGDGLKDEIKKAYKNYSFFNTSDCGTLQVSESAYLFNQPEAEIKDPLPAFIDILTPYRNIIKGFLTFIALVIGLFDFFRRS